MNERGGGAPPTVRPHTEEAGEGGETQKGNMFWFVFADMGEGLAAVSL